MDAALALNVKSDSVLKAANDLDRFSTSAEKAAAAGKKVTLGGASGSIAKLVAEVQSANSKLAAIVGTLDKIASADRAAAVANDNLSRSFGAADAHVTAYRQHLEAMVASQKAATASMRVADAHVIAYTQHLAGLASAQKAASASTVQADAHVEAYRKHLAGVGDGAKTAATAIKFTAVEGLNASRQLADIGVTAAMGMNPFLIAIQQGPQLLDILQGAAIRTGTTISAAFRAAAAAVLTGAAPFLPLIALLGLAAAGIAGMTKQANDDSGLKKYAAGAGYTKAEVEKLNAVTVTFGDTFRAVFQVGFQRIAEAFGIDTANMAKAWDRLLDRITTGTRATIAGVYASFFAVGDLGRNIGRDAVSGNLSTETLTRGFKERYAQAQGFMSDVVSQARLNAQNRQNEMAKGFYDKPKVPKGPKTDAEKLADIYAGAEADIAAEKTRGLAAANNLGAQEAAKLEKQTALLNAVQQKGIPITDAVRKKVGELADEYARVKTEADISTAFNNVTNDIDLQRMAVEDQTRLVGLYGEALARATREMEAQQRFRAALPNGEVVVAGNLTGGLSDDLEALQRDQRLADIRKASQDATYAMDLERTGLGLTGAAALSYAYATERLNEAKRAGRDLSASEIEAIRAAGKAYGEQRYAIDQQAQSIADTREITRGFLSDLINGAREGGNAFRSLADAAVNSLNRIINKLLDRTLDNFLNGLFPSRAAALPDVSGMIAANPSIFAKGGMFSDPMRFANGGAFTNSIVTAPTLFRFANGGKLGEMGEAGPEAIMPLKRGPNGALGVQMHGGGKPSIRMGDIYNTYPVSGAIDQSQIVAMIRQGGAATYDQVKRDLQMLLQQLDNDGSFAS